MKTITSPLLLLAALLTFCAPAALADDEDDVRAVIAQYVATETTDLAKQAALMTDDREYINAGFRTTNNVANMRGQIAAQKRNQAMDPNTQAIVTIEDLRVRMYNNVATASFYRFFNVILSAEAVAAGRTRPGKSSQWFSPKSVTTGKSCKHTRARLAETRRGQYRGRTGIYAVVPVV